MHSTCWATPATRSCQISKGWPRRTGGSNFFWGSDYSADSYGGGLTYWHLLFGGSFNGAFTMSDNTTSTSSGNALGFSGTASYNKRFNHWAAGGAITSSRNALRSRFSLTEISPVLASVTRASPNCRPVRREVFSTSGVERRISLDVNSSRGWSRRETNRRA